MNEITSKPISKLGEDFIDAKYIPDGLDQHYIRNQQAANKAYRALTPREIESLEKTGNTASNWSLVMAADGFDPTQVKNCSFFGVVRLGRLDPVIRRFHNVTLPVGLYNSTIINCDFGDNVIVNRVDYMAHYIIGNDVILLNIHELHVTDHSKFGNGVIKQGEPESVRIWVEVCNENAGRKILPFDGMLPGDAWLWSKYRDDDLLMQRFREFTEQRFDARRGYYGMIGDRTVIKNTGIMKDVLIGTDAYIKGANKLKNLTINSSASESSQIGEGCELVNGIIDYGCRVFYGVKAVRFVMASHSQLKYGARLINSFLGNNSTISCCEVLNSLIFPGHEQHHNNSFLCAAMVMGQSNIAAGATIGSNHNSRAADGEILASRGFWPGLCVSLKHNSRFASFTLLAKGDYPYELNISLPFCLVSNDTAQDCLSVMPGYWFMYNMYALARNSDKLQRRDLRMNKAQHIEYAYLAPDTINEIFDGLRLLALATAQSYLRTSSDDPDMQRLLEAGHQILNDASIDLHQIEITVKGFEHGNRKVVIQKARQAYHLFKDLILHYAVEALVVHFEFAQPGSLDEFIETLPEFDTREFWLNVGGQLISTQKVAQLKQKIYTERTMGWAGVHQFYQHCGETYQRDKLRHALASLSELRGLTEGKEIGGSLKSLLYQTLEIKEFLLRGVIQSRSKDYQNEFRKMLYDNDKEMEAVVGRFDDNSFIAEEKERFQAFRAKMEMIIERFQL